MNIYEFQEKDDSLYKAKKTKPIYPLNRQQIIKKLMIKYIKFKRVKLSESKIS